ncbi:hypothetical protein AZE42_09767 [Rhizopogon vesiculosus]|uniref:DUF7598 domain-containing protein n=1 Tax=Rhizopogon vesiculosus TaxID=180088 RepID=A0A1J8R9M4_9AGAM|nr:hypothetical protein AZE42_09767 [Rhizopogon vesiculosus]
MMLPAKAYVFISLNAVRALSIIALLLVFSSSILVMVDDVEAVNVFVSGGSNSNSTSNYDYINNSTIPNQPAGVFWAVLNRLLIIAQTVVLILSELGWPATFFDHYFPVLGSDFGVGALGLMQCLIGASVLSHFVKVFPLVSAFFLFSIGCLNILIGLVFRERVKTTRSILSFRDRVEDVLPPLDRNIETPISKYMMNRDVEKGPSIKEPEVAHTS